jgi:hypothetical protein
MELKKDPRTERVFEKKKYMLNPQLETEENKL